MTDQREKWWIETIDGREVVCKTCGCCGNKQILTELQVRRVSADKRNKWIALAQRENDSASTIAGNLFLVGMGIGAILGLAAARIVMRLLQVEFMTWQASGSFVFVYFAVAMTIFSAGMQWSKDSKDASREQQANLLYGVVAEHEITKIGAQIPGGDIALIPFGVMKASDMPS